MLAQARDGGARIRHPVYVHARRAAIAGLLAPLLRAAGAILLGVAVRALRLDRRIAYGCYALALGCADLAGYTRACAQQAARRRARRHAGVPADASAGEQSLDPGHDLPGVGRPDALGQRLREVGQKVA